MSKSNFKLITQLNQPPTFSLCLKRMDEYRRHLEQDSVIGLAAAITAEEKIKVKADAREAVENGEPEAELEEQ
jgi:hypothetical protein